jgi:hypothetical protein
MPARLVAGHGDNGLDPRLAVLKTRAVPAHAPVVEGFQKIEKIRHRSCPFSRTQLGPHRCAPYSGLP